MRDVVEHDKQLMKMFLMTLLPFRTTLCNLIHQEFRNDGDIFVGQFGISGQEVSVKVSHLLASQGQILHSTSLFLGRDSTFPTANVPYRHTRRFSDLIWRELALVIKVVSDLKSLGILSFKIGALFFIKNVRHAVNPVQKNSVSIPHQRHIFGKVPIKKFKSANNCLENHNRLSHVQASLVATFGSYGLQESAIFYKEAA